jgi:opine dehydrogenase
MTTVAIVGAGIGGVYLAAKLGRLGAKTRLTDRDDSRLADIRARGGIEVEADGKTSFAAIERVTTDLAEAVEGADVIAVCTGGTFQEGVARGIAPLLVDGQTILLIQGNTGGALAFRRALDVAGCRATVDIAEMDNYPYSCWRVSPTHIKPIVMKKGLQIAAFPGNRGEAVFARLGPLFPGSVLRPSIAWTSLMNANAMLHVANCVGNAGKIDRGEGYKFYAEGVTPAVGRLYQAINAERVAIAAALGAQVPSLEDWFALTYGVRGTTLSETCQLLTTNSDGPYQATGTPRDWSHKYIAEDVPVGLVPMRALAQAVDVPCPAIDAVIKLAQTLAGNDFATDARTLERMGLAGMDAGQVRRTLDAGFK